VTPILSVPEALMRLGARQVAQLITSVSVMRVFVPRSEGHRNLWRHAIQVAVAARTLAANWPGGVDPQQAYVVGLLHDIGRFVMFEHDPVDFDAVESSLWRTPDELLAAERDICGFDHAEIGWRAGKVWGLPDQLADGIRNHHATALDGCVSGEVERLLRVVQLSDALSCRLMGCSSFSSLDAEARRAIVEPLCAAVPGVHVTPVNLASFAGAIQDESTTLAAALGIRQAGSPVGCGPKRA
jgi:putative nucleotidyltransferase with HDIG domain